MKHAPERVADAVTVLLDVLAERIAARAHDDAGDLVSAESAQLTPRRFFALCRRRQSAGKPGVVRAGRQFLLTRDAWAEECTALNTTEPLSRKRRSDGLDRLDARLRLVGGGL